LETNPGIPFGAQRRINTALKLRFAGKRIGQVLDHVLCGLLVSFLGNDDVFFVEVGSRRGINSGYFLDEMRFGKLPTCA
jgi:hypothetical protein